MSALPADAYRVVRQLRRTRYGQGDKLLIELKTYSEDAQAIAWHLINPIGHPDKPYLRKCLDRVEAEKLLTSPVPCL